MSLTGVKMSEDVWLTCLTHALSTETEEIMGLLLGDIEYSKNGSVTALIWGASPQSRSDRRKDRVETNPEQLAAASAQAENDCINRADNKGDWVVPFTSSYYSSPVSCRCADSGNVSTSRSRVGLIFSCYSEDINKVGRIQVIAFQSSDGKQNKVSRPISTSLVNRSYIDVESSLSSSENTSVKSGSARVDSPEHDTSDSRTAAGSNKDGVRSLDLGDYFANADASYVGRERIGGSYPSGNPENAVVDIDPMDMSEGMQEAMHRSNMEMTGAEYIRKAIPLQVLPTSSLVNLNSSLISFTDLQRVLYEEERGAYNQAIFQNMRDGKVHPLTFVHHTAMYQASMCKLIEYWLETLSQFFVSSSFSSVVYFLPILTTLETLCTLSPAINALQDRLRENEIQLAMLTDETKMLEAEASKVSEPFSRSPRHAPSHSLRGSATSGQREMHSSSESLSARTVASPGNRTRIGF